MRARCDARLASAWDDEQASSGRVIAPAWLPHPCKSSGAELTTPISLWEGRVSRGALGSVCSLG
jgi:hypothetical protein